MNFDLPCTCVHAERNQTRAQVADEELGNVHTAHIYIYSAMSCLEEYSNLRSVSSRVVLTSTGLEIDPSPTVTVEIS